MGNKQIEMIYSIVKNAKEIGMSHLSIQGGAFTGVETIKDSGDSFVNFSLCDYLKLSTDNRVRQAAADSILKNGVYAAVSRTYMKLSIYEEAEQKVSEVFGKPVIITPRTTLGHIAAIPVLVDRHDAVILDHQVHTSVRLATDIVASHGIHVETIRHNRMDKLEERINSLSETYDKIWYMADGIYSMYGDTMPVKAVESLLNRYDNFRLYVDDAHGMGVFGEHGKGYVLSEMDYHKNMFLATSLGKGFGSGGGVLVCPDELTKEQILYTGSTLIFTSPPEPSILGSIIKATEIHRSEQGEKLRKQLNEHLEFFYTKAKELNLPLIDTSRTPIAFVAAGNPEMVTGICHRMLRRGYHITPGVYPATSFNNGGVRIVLSLYQSKHNIESMLEVLKEEYDKMLLKYDTSVEKILSYYKK